MSGDWYVQLMGQTIGPLSDQELRRYASSRQVVPETPLRKGPSGQWVTAERVRGLFPGQDDEVAPSTPKADQSTPPDAPTTKNCPYCAEEIRANAVKCKHCGEFLDQAARPPWSAGGPRGPNPGIAAVLSLVIPGAGQMYKGQVGSGLAWLVAVAVGYILILPGVILHLACIGYAASDGSSSRYPIELKLNSEPITFKPDGEAAPPVSVDSTVPPLVVLGILAVVLVVISIAVF